MKKDVLTAPNKQLLPADNKSRIQWIDGLKGFAILTVVFLHAHNGYQYEGTINYVILKWITSFHMPLFLACAGYFFDIENQGINIRKALQKKAHTLVVPYVVWGIVIGFFVENIRIIIRNKNGQDFLQVLTEVMTGRASWLSSWFIGALIGVYCVQYLCVFLLRNNKFKIAAWTGINISLLILGYTLRLYRIGKYFRVSIVFVSCFFFMLGFYVNKILSYLETKYRDVQILLCLILLVLGALLCFSNSRVAYFLQQYGSLILHTASASMTILGLFLSAKLLYDGKFLVFVNRLLLFAFCGAQWPVVRC